MEISRSWPSGQSSWRRWIIAGRQLEHQSAATLRRFLEPCLAVGTFADAAENRQADAGSLTARRQALEDTEDAPTILFFDPGAVVTDLISHRRADPFAADVNAQGLLATTMPQSVLESNPQEVGETRRVDQHGGQLADRDPGARLGNRHGELRQQRRQRLLDSAGLYLAARLVGSQVEFDITQQLLQADRLLTDEVQ